MLMLEATIGLNEVAGEASGSGSGEEPNLPEASSEQDDKPFNAQDLSFLRSLRIKIEEDGQDEEKEENG